jgi:hypothetical protein
MMDVVYTHVLMVIMLMIPPNIVNYVTDLVSIVSDLLPMNVPDVKITNIYITILVITHVHKELMPKNTLMPKTSVKIVTKDVLSVLMKPITNVLNVTIHGYSSETLV